MQAERYPDRPAVIYYESGTGKGMDAGSDLNAGCGSDNGTAECISYQTFYEDILNRAAVLEKSGPQVEGILPDGSYASVVEIFAANAAGSTVVMLEPSEDPSLMKQRIEKTDVSLLWTWGGAHELGKKEAEAVEDRILFFTSGTTASARAVELSGESLLASAYNGSQALPLTPEDRLLCILPLYHVFGFVCSLLWGLVNGASVALGRGQRHLMDDLEFFHPTVVSLVPVLFEFYLKRNLFNPELKTILIGAGGCPKELIEMARNRGIHVCFGYGLTETSSGVALSTGGDLYAMDVCVEDKVTISPEGEILVESPACMMKGYYRDPEATAEVLKDGVLHTGDIGFLDSGGRLHVTGRMKDILVLPDGTKIFLPEYEAIIMRALPDLETACGEEDGEIILYYYGDWEVKQVEDVLSGLMSLMPRGHQVRHIVRRSAPIPRNAAGKIVRSQLADKRNDHDKR
ncbi:MAG: class I adenylate-forming enzyme family protein [Eubacteriales bacterium]